MQTQKIGIVINGTFELAAEDRQRFIDAVRPNLTETLQEAGCVYYALSIDVNNENLFHLSEGWIDQQSLTGHLDGEAFKATQRKVSALRILASDLTKYLVSDQKHPMDPT